MTQTIADDNGIEIMVGYEHINKSESALGWPKALLKSVEVVVAGRGIDILPLLHPAEKDFIISKLNAE